MNSSPSYSKSEEKVNDVHIGLACLLLSYVLTTLPNAVPFYEALPDSPMIPVTSSDRASSMPTNSE